MPIYDFKCPDCGRIEDHLVSSKVQYQEITCKVEGAPRACILKRMEVQTKAPAGHVYGVGAYKPAATGSDE